MTYPTIFGTQIDGGEVNGWPILVDRAREANVSWLRYGAVNWSAVEPTPGARDWSSADGEIKALAANHVLQVTLFSTPSWAQLWNGYYCGPIKNDQATRDRFWTFVRDMVERYDGDGYYDVPGLPRYRNCIVPACARDRARFWHR